MRSLSNVDVEVISTLPWQTSPPSRITPMLPMSTFQELLCCLPVSLVNKCRVPRYSSQCFPDTVNAVIRNLCGRIVRYERLLNMMPNRRAAFEIPEGPSMKSQHQFMSLSKTEGSSIHLLKYWWIVTTTSVFFLLSLR